MLGHVTDWNFRNQSVGTDGSLISQTTTSAARHIIFKAVLLAAMYALYADNSVGIRHRYQIATWADSYLARQLRGQTAIHGQTVTWAFSNGSRWISGQTATRLDSYVGRQQYAVRQFRRADSYMDRLL